MKSENLALILVRADCGSCQHSNECGPDVFSVFCSNCVLGTQSAQAKYCHWRRHEDIIRLHQSTEAKDETIARLAREVEYMNKLANKMLRRNLDLHAVIARWQMKDDEQNSRGKN